MCYSNKSERTLRSSTSRHFIIFEASARKAAVEMELLYKNVHLVGYLSRSHNRDVATLADI